MKKQFNLTTGFGDQIWYLDTKDRSDEILSGRIWPMRLHLHRTDGPAVVWADGRQEWWVNCKRHRTDGPAYIWPNGSQFWFVNDKRYRDNKSFQEAAGITDEEMVMVIIKYGDVK